ncbi:MAG: dTDP-4-dehydrorhamnose reductase [Hyphomicrobiaceae bacterium]|nr:dTDP-4-dehydrorhamnose reductase [Hyphomicrobiaceae bacterium]
MKILVTGAEGQVARSLLEAATTDVEIVAVGRPTLDLTRADTIGAVLRAVCPDLLVNAAAYTAVDKAESEPEQAHQVNATGAGNAAAAAHAAGIPILHISTDYVFDGSKSGAYLETDPTGPAGVYGRSKLAGEEAVAAANPQHLILRTAWVYSPFGNNFVKTMLRLAESRDTLSVVDDQRGSPTYAPHLADAVLKIAQQLSMQAGDHAVWGVYHAVGGGETTWCGLAREVLRLSALRGGPHATVAAIPTSAYPTPARRPANSRLSVAKLKDRFGVNLPDWQVGVAACIDRLLANAGGTGGNSRQEQKG